MKKFVIYFTDFNILMVLVYMVCVLGFDTGILTGGGRGNISARGRGLYTSRCAKYMCCNL